MRLSTVRASVKSIDPDARVSTRGLVHGDFVVRTNKADAVIEALADDGLELLDREIEGSRYDWVTVLWFGPED